MLWDVGAPGWKSTGGPGRKKIKEVQKYTWKGSVELAHSPNTEKYNNCKKKTNRLSSLTSHWSNILYIKSCALFLKVKQTNISNTVPSYNLFLVHSWGSVFQASQTKKRNTAHILMLHHETCFKRKQVVYCKTHHKPSKTIHNTHIRCYLEILSSVMMDLNLLPCITNRIKLQFIFQQAETGAWADDWTVVLANWFQVCVMLYLPCDGREGCGARLGLLGAEGSPWVGEGQGLLRGEGRGEDPGPVPAPGCRCWGRISSTSSSTSPGRGEKRVSHHLCL